MVKQRIAVRVRDFHLFVPFMPENGHLWVGFAFFGSFYVFPACLIRIQFNERNAVSQFLFTTREKVSRGSFVGLAVVIQKRWAFEINLRKIEASSKVLQYYKSEVKYEYSTQSKTG